MSSRRAAADPECGLSIALALIAGKWKASIVWELHERPIRFGELKRRMCGISEKVLYEQLRELEADGIVHREVFDELPARVEYSLTTDGATFNDVLHALGEWGLSYSLRRADHGASVTDAHASASAAASRHK